MSCVIDALMKKEMLISSGSVTSDRIAEAEKALGLTFASDYKEYLSRLGSASFIGHELTGISTSVRVNVAASTLRSRKLFPDISLDWYVIEETNIDGIILWQDSTGCVHQTQPNKEPQIVASNLAEYINKL